MRCSQDYHNPQEVLGMSFTNPAFTFARRTCIAASKTVLKEARQASDDQGPVLWIDQAFSVAAGIILALDAFHRQIDEPEYDSHRKLVQGAIEVLNRYDTSMIATHGVNLLSTLSKELENASSLNPSLKRKRDDESGEYQGGQRSRVFNIATFVRSFIEDRSRTTEGEEPTSPAFTSEAFAAMFPPQTGFGDEYLFENLLEFDFT
jgi:hypothetical protein